MAAKITSIKSVSSRTKSRLDARFILRFCRSSNDIDKTRFALARSFLLLRASKCYATLCSSYYHFPIEFHSQEGCSASESGCFHFLCSRPQSIPPDGSSPLHRRTTALPCALDQRRRDGAAVTCAHRYWDTSAGYRGGQGQVTPCET